jgi:hypothetical protein
MRLWFDTEFIEDGSTIDLMSIGIVDENGQTFYAELSDCRLERASPWVMQNVIPKLTGLRTHQFTRQECKEEVIKFCGPKPEFWTYYGAYDWVALCQLFGTMMELPDDWPRMAFDVKQLAKSRFNPLLIKQDDATAHNALFDAIWTRDAFLALLGSHPLDVNEHWLKDTVS